MHGVVACLNYINGLEHFIGLSGLIVPTHASHATRACVFHVEYINDTYRLVG